MHKQTPIDEQRLAVASFRKFLDSEVAPVAREFRDRPMPKGRMRELTQGIAEFGLPGASIAEKHGGMGLARTTEALLFEELCAVSADVALCVKTNKAVAGFLAGLPPRHAALRDRYLPDILSGRVFAAFCLGEPAVGAAARCSITARRDGDEIILDGEEARMANGHYADFIIVLAGADDGSSMQVLVDRRAHGFVTRNIDNIALNSQSTAQVCLTQTRVPAGHVLEDQRGHSCLVEATSTDTGMLCVGLMRAAVEASTEHARQQPPGMGYPLAAVQLAEMMTLLDAARLLCLRAYERMDAGHACGTQASMAKWYASEMAVQVCRNAVQLHGGNGLARAFEVERLAREAIALPLCDGATDTHKLLIARDLAGIALPD